MGVFEILAESDGRVEADTKAWLGARFEALEQPFDALFEIFGAIQQERPETQFPDGPFQATLVYARVMQHLWVAWRLTLSGHYIDAINTLKIVNECNLLALLLARDDEAARRWEQGENGFRPVQVRAALSKHLSEDEAQAKLLAKELSESYGLVCKIAHPNPTSIEWIRQGLRQFSTTGSFHQARCSGLLLRLVDELSLAIPGLAKVVIDAGCVVPQDHVADLLRVLSKIRSTFQPAQQAAASSAEQKSSGAPA